MSFLRPARPAPPPWAFRPAAFTARAPRTPRHIGANIVIAVDSADSARGESAMLLFTGPGNPLVGAFHDRFVRTPEGWRFAE